MRSRHETAAVSSSGAFERSESHVNLNKNTTWLNESGAWTFYVVIIFLSYLVTCSFVDVGLAWTYTHLAHSLVTFYFLHWAKGSPLQEDQVQF